MAQRVWHNVARPGAWRRAGPNCRRGMVCAHRYARGSSAARFCNLETAERNTPELLQLAGAGGDRVDGCGLRAISRRRKPTPGAYHTDRDHTRCADVNVVDSVSDSDGTRLEQASPNSQALG